MSPLPCFFFFNWGVWFEVIMMEDFFCLFVCLKQLLSNLQHTGDYSHPVRLDMLCLLFYPNWIMLSVSLLKNSLKIQWSEFLAEQDKFTRKWNVVEYSTPMPMESEVKFLSPQSISGASQQNRGCSVLLNNWNTCWEKYQKKSMKNGFIQRLGSSKCLKARDPKLF